MGRHHKFLGLLPLIVLPVAVLVFTPASAPRWIFMWSLAAAILVGCKWLTWSEARGRGVPLPLQVGYLLAWPGLDAQAFLTSHKAEVERPRLSEWTSGAIKLLAGIVLFWGLARRVPDSQGILRGWVGMAGLILMLH